MSTAGLVLDRTQERMEAVRQHMENGLSARQSAAALGVTTRTVTRMRARLRGYTMPHIPAPSPEQLAIYEQRLNEGWSFKEIARTYHCCENMLSRRFPGRGWDRHEVGRAGAAGRVMNNLPTFLDTVNVSTFASIKVQRAVNRRRKHARGYHVNELRRVGA